MRRFFPPPSDIPPVEFSSEFLEDRALRALVMQWINLHKRLEVCRSRIFWGNKAAKVIEKKRRKEQWQVISRIFEIERQCIRWMAKETKHPDIWMSKKIEDPVSKYVDLQRAYYRRRRLTRKLKGRERRESRDYEEVLVGQIRALTRTWMCALLVQAFNDRKLIPKPIRLHPRELIPRKIKRASKLLIIELTETQMDRSVAPSSKTVIHATLSRR